MFQLLFHLSGLYCMFPVADMDQGLGPGATRTRSLYKTTSLRVHTIL